MRVPLFYQVKRVDTAICKPAIPVDNKGGPYYNHIFPNIVKGTGYGKKDYYGH